MQYNIYFRKDNWEKFKDEPNKSSLVNELLDKHYGQYPLKNQNYPKIQTKIEAREPSKPKEVSEDRAVPPKSGLENLDDDWNGPMYRNKQKGKL